MAKIKPLGQLQVCPFCKKDDAVIVYTLENQYFYVSCFRCVTVFFDFSTVECRTQEEAEACWNMRPERRTMTDNILSCPLCGNKAGWKAISGNSNYEVLGCLHGCGAKTMSVLKDNYEAKNHILHIWNEKITYKSQKT